MLHQCIDRRLTSAAQQLNHLLLGFFVRIVQKPEE
jgi:hypothetical protein